MVGSKQDDWYKQDGRGESIGRMTLLPDYGQMPLALAPLLSLQGG